MNCILEDHVKGLRERGYIVSSVMEVGRMEVGRCYRNRYTQKAEKAIGVYNLADSQNNHGKFYLFESGRALPEGDLSLHWDLVDDSAWRAS
jgi:hypothetical protein